MICRAASSLFLAVALLAGGTARASVQGAWAGELEVLSEAGTGCSKDGTAPQRLRMYMARVSPSGPAGEQRLLAWGEFQTVMITMRDGASTALGEPLTRDASWQVRLSLDPHASPTGVTGTWQEFGLVAGATCLFDRARFVLRAAEDSAAADQVLAQGRAIALLHRHAAAMLQSVSASEWRDAARDLLANVDDEWMSAAANREVATLLLDGARRGWAFRQRELAHAVAARSSSMLKEMGRDEAVFAARAIRREASMLRRLAGPDAGHDKLDEAVAWLNRHGLSDSADMAALLSTRGTWSMQAEDWISAQRAFEQASRIELQRPGTAGEQAVALHNWAAAVDQGGRADEAQALWRAALALITESPDPGDRALSALIQESLDRHRPSARRAPVRRDHDDRLAARRLLPAV